VAPLSGAIVEAFGILERCIRDGGKVMVCGNGGSAADAEHIVGEMMKDYLMKRPIPQSDARKIIAAAPQAGPELCSKLQRVLPALSLVSQVSLSTAMANDVDAGMAFAQQVYGYGRSGDVLIAISTSGNARNVLYAAMVAKAFDIAVIGMTGANGGNLKEWCDVAICAPADTTWRIQEYHQPIYHAVCGMLEAEIFGD